MCLKNVCDVPQMYQNLTPNWFRDIIYNIYTLFDLSIDNQSATFVHLVGIYYLIDFFGVRCVSSMTCYLQLLGEVNFVQSLFLFRIM